MPKKKSVDPIPEEFESYEDAAAFWDSHDTTDYPDAFHTVAFESELRKRHYEIEIDGDVLRKLRAQARRKGVSPGHLASHLLRQRLAANK